MDDSSPPRTYSCRSCGEYWPLLIQAHKCCQHLHISPADTPAQLQIDRDTVVAQTSAPAGAVRSDGALTLKALMDVYICKVYDLMGGAKKDDYASKDNRLANFDRAAAFRGKRPEEVCMDWLTKHMDALAAAVDEDKVKWHWHDSSGNEGTKQRITDAIAYCLLLAAILERKETGRDVVG